MFNQIKINQPLRFDAQGKPVQSEEPPRNHRSNERHLQSTGWVDSRPSSRRLILRAPTQKAGHRLQLLNLVASAQKQKGTEGHRVSGKGSCTALGWLFGRAMERLWVPEKHGAEIVSFLPESHECCKDMQRHVLETRMFVSPNICIA